MDKRNVDTLVDR